MYEVSHFPPPPTLKTQLVLVLLQYSSIRPRSLDNCCRTATKIPYATCHTACVNFIRKYDGGARAHGEGGVVVVACAREGDTNNSESAMLWGDEKPVFCVAEPCPQVLGPETKKVPFVAPGRVSERVDAERDDHLQARCQEMQRACAAVVSRNLFLRHPANKQTKTTRTQITICHNLIRLV